MLNNAINIKKKRYFKKIEKKYNYDFLIKLK